MKRCPKHPDIIVYGGPNKCEAWVDKKCNVDFRCGHILEPLSSKEIQKIRTEELKQMLENTKLPPWTVTGIRQIAYSEHHSCGQDEVDMAVMEWMYIFEELQQNAIKHAGG